MMIIDKPYASDELKKFLEESKTPVLKNDFALEILKEYRLNLKEEGEFKKLAKDGLRICTISENSLDWIYNNIDNENMISGIRAMKNKTEVRRMLQSVYPGFFFMEADAADLSKIDFNTLKLPFVLKPSIGFFSVGVYTVFSEKDWKAAIEDINSNMDEWKKHYPESVIGNNSFIMEEYIEGDEYAIDAYFDENGKAVIVNIMKHEFSSAADVSDRLYYTGRDIIEQMLHPFTHFLEKTNSFFKVSSFPLHVEVRVRNGEIIPIEFNPMRFAGWCTTDITYFAYGYKTYDYFLNNIRPDWRKILQDKNGKIFSLVLLDKPKSYKNWQKFDYDAVLNKFGKVLKMRKTENPGSPVFGFIFAETDARDTSELDYIGSSDLTEFLSK